MAVKPSNAALTALRNNRREKQNELVGAYTAMGGSDTALLAKPTIPKLESAINNLYQSAQSGGRDTYADRQAMSNAYNDYANARTSDKLKHVKSESLAQLVSQPTIMGMANPMYGNLSDDMKSAGLTLEELERLNKAKSRQTYEDVASQIGAEHPLIATGLAAAEQPLMSLGNVAKNVRNYALGNPIENNFNPATALRQSVAENNIDTKVGNFAYGVGNSMADMLIASLAGANAGPGIMGLEKADQVMNSAVDRGLTPNQIMAEGVGSGITTGLTEMIPFREFKAGDNILRSMRNEGIQEGAEDIADTLLDYIVTQIGGNPEKSELAMQYQAYRDAGYSEEDAKNAVVVDYLKQLGLDAAAGALAGGGMGGINNVSQGYNFFRGNTNANTETNADENVKADIEQTIPTLRDSRAEESAIQEQRNAELAQLTEAVAQMREQQNAQTVPQVQNYDPEAMEFLRNTLREANGIEINPENIRLDEQTEQQIPEVTQPVQNESIPQEVHDYVKRRDELTNYIAENQPSYAAAQQIINSINAMDEYMFQNHPEWMDGESGNFKREEYDLLNSAVADQQAQPNIPSVQQTVLNNSEVGENLNRAIPEADADIPNQTQQTGNDTYSDEDIQNLSTVEDATTALNDEVSALNNEVGNHPMNIEYFSRNERGEVESEDSDRVQTGRYKTSKTYTNTAENSGNLTDEQRRMVEQNGSMLYQENSWKESTEEAEKRIINGGWQGEFEKLTQKDAKSFNNVDVDELFMLWRHFKEQAVALDKKGLDSTSTWQKTVDCLTQLKAVGSSAGSELNAFKKWSMNNTPEGLMAEAEIIIDEYITGLNEGAKKIAKKNPWLARIVKETKGKTRQMDVGFIKQFLTEAEKLAPTHTVQEGESLADIAKAYNTTVDALIELNGKDIKPGDTITVNRLDMDSNEARLIMANLGKMVNTQIPVSLREKITTLLMDNMLGNFRTLITRNFGGNVGYNVIEQKVTKNLAAKIDKALSEKRGTNRTISENTSEGKIAYREGFKEAFRQEWYDLVHNIRTARSGENNLRTAVSNNRQIFSDKNIFGKIGNFYDRLVRSGLSVGDRPFYEGVYRQYMTEYKKMFDQGLLGDMTKEEFDELAQANAQIKALEAVYQDDSDMAEAFMAAKNFVSLASRSVTGADILSQFTMPFVKTPANIIQRAVEYSPLGIIRNAVRTTRELRHTMTANGMMDFDQQRFATETARNLIGTVMFGMFVMLADAGGLTGAYDEDKDMAQAQREAGMQEYALHLPINGGMDVDVSSMPVIGNDIVAAAAAYDAFKNNPELTTLQRVGRGLSAGIGKQFETSTLQGLQRLFGASSSYGYGKQGNDGSIIDQAKDTIKAGATQLIPSLLRQFSSAADPYQRRLTGVNPDDYYINNLRSAIPWLRQDLQPKIGRTGEMLEQNHAQTVGGRWFNNFINPFNVTYGTEDAVRDEAMRLYESTGNNIAFQPYVSLNELKTDDHIPTDEEFTQYQQNAYGAMNQIATQVIGSSYYQNLTDGEKESLLASIYQAVKSVEKANILGTDKSNLSGAAKAYNEGGAEGIIDYVTAQSALSSLGVTNNEDNRNAVLASLNANGGDLSAIAEQYDNSVARAGTDLDLLMNNQYSGLIETIGTWDSDAQRELREEINSIINGVEFNSTVGIDKDYDGAKKAYDEGGVNGLAEYLFPATVLKNNGMTNNEKNREMILNAYNEGGANAVQQIIQASQALGNDSNLTYKYEHATSYIPSLTPTQFQSTWNAINTDGNTSIKIDEMLDYLNQNPGAYDSNSALQYWNAFYTGTSEKIPVLVNGHWEAKKP
jgi:hypothetical protein